VLFSSAFKTRFAFNERGISPKHKEKKRRRKTITKKKSKENSHSLG
jgi:hypothetical protein